MTRFWRTALFAAGPGILVCAAMGVVEFSDARSLLIDLVGAYPVTLLAFLPAIPLLTFLLLRAFPERPVKVAPRVHVGWLVASWVAPFWHVLTAELFLRALAMPSPVRWAVVLRYSVCLWLITAFGRLCTMDRPDALNSEDRRGSASRVNSGVSGMRFPDLRVDQPEEQASLPSTSSPQLLDWPPTPFTAEPCRSANVGTV